MDVGIVVMGAALVALTAGFVAFWRHSHTQAWSRSETRAAAMGFLISIAPFFGGRVQPPKPEIPVVMTPGPDWSDGDAPLAAGSLDDAAEPPPGRG
ncbi:MAG TPA: hypothetical protein VFO60_00800 [Candidatus Dormibacteraeota bacterium]|nr:hypothetical protein [Candidatus Dormibacteraeota bacterium]